LITVLLLSFTGCKKEAADVPEVPETPSAPTTPTTPPTITTEDNPGSDTISVTVPAFWLSDDDEFDPSTLEEDGPYSEVKLNDDGTVTMVLPREAYQEAMVQSRLALEEMFAELQGDEGIPFIKMITYNDDFTEITMDVDKTLYNQMPFDFFHDMIGMTVGIHLQFMDNTAKCHYTVKDATTGEVLLEKTYPDDLTQPQ